MKITSIKNELKSLGISLSNPGVGTGTKWIKSSGAAIESYSPVDGKLIGKVQGADEASFTKVMALAEKAFAEWKKIPAPRRGEVVRQVGEALRAAKEPLGKLVSYEMGKSYQEGLGEVQEMIDICDFAVGLSRQLHGLTMHSERPNHRMYEQYHPLGIVGVYYCIQFSCCCVVMERDACLGLRRCLYLEAVGENSALQYRMSEHHLPCVHEKWSARRCEVVL